MDVFDLVAKLSLDQSEYESGLSDAESKASSFGSGLKTAMGVGAVAVGAVTTAIAGASVAFGNGIANLASYGDNIDKMSQKMGISAEKYQEWDAVMQHSGTSMETMKASMKTLANAVENGNEAFQRLGLSQEQLATMSQEDIFEATIAGLQNVEDTTERTYLAGQLLGRGATELGALLNTSAEDTQAMRDRVHELGGVMSDEAVKASAKYQDTLQDMTTAFDGLKRGLMSDFLPSVTTVMEGLTEVFSGNYDEGIDQITEGIEQTINNATELIPQMTEIGGGIISALINAFSSNADKIFTAGAEIIGQIGNALLENAPQIFESAGQILFQITNGIISALPQIASTAISIIVSLANGIGEALPTMIPTIVDVVLQIVTTLIEHIPEIIGAGLAIAQGLIEGLVEAIPMIVDALPELIDAILTALIDSADAILDGALTMFMAIVDAIPQIVNALSTALPQIVSKVVSFLTGDGLPKVLNGAIQMLMAIIQAIPTILTALTSALPQIISSITDILISNAPEILMATLELLGGILEAIPQIVASLASAVPSIVTAITQPITAGLSNLGGLALKWGGDLVNGFISGITGKLAPLRDKVKGLADTIKSYLHFSEPDVGPLSDFHTYAPDMMELFMKGITDNEDKLNNTVSNAFDFKDAMTAPEWDTSRITKSSANTNDYNAIKKALGEMNITLYNTTEIDGKTIHEDSYQYSMNRMTDDTRNLRIAHGGAY